MSEPSESKFKSAVEAAAAGDGRIKSVVVNGFFVGLEVLSQRKRSSWHGSFKYDPATGDVEYYSQYPNSSQVWGFANEVRRRLRDD